MVKSIENMQDTCYILIEGFTARLHREGLAPGSIDQYVRAVKALIGAFPERQPQDLSRDDVETWIDMVARDVSPATTNLRIAALKRFYAYLVDREIVTGANPTARLKASKLQRRKVDWLQADEDQALLNAPTTPQERIVVGCSGTPASASGRRAGSEFGTWTLSAGRYASTRRSQSRGSGSCRFEERRWSS